MKLTIRLRNGEQVFDVPGIEPFYNDNILWNYYLSCATVATQIMNFMGCSFDVAKDLVRRSSKAAHAFPKMTVEYDTDGPKETQ